MNSKPPRRIHITGGPGAGKSRLARRLSARLGLTYHNIDVMALGIQAEMADPFDYADLMTRRLQLVEKLASEEAWISDGSNLEASRPFYDRADVIVYLGCTWRLAAYRIPVRHMKLSLAGSNPFPSLSGLVRFWRWSRRYYANSNPHGLNEYGTPATMAYHGEALQDYADRLVVCRTKDEVQALEQRLSC
jgi:hypothetical protein